MSDLVAFLEARLAEDEAAARKAAETDGADWYASSSEPNVYARDGGPVAVGPYGCDVGVSADHIARHDPARVLQDIAAKQRIIAEHALNGWVCGTCDNGETDQVFPCLTLRLLALPYSDRPGYRREWEP